MTPRPPLACAWEHDVARAAAGQPEAADPAVRAHAEACGTCREVIAVTSALRRADAAAGTRRVPDAALVWHRAQMRARRDNAREAAGPIWAMQIAAGAIALLLCAIFAGELATIVADGARAVSTAAVSGAASLREAAGLATRDQALRRVADAFGGPILTVLLVGSILVAAAFSLSRLADRSPRG